VSIGKRLVNLVRSNLSSLLDRQGADEHRSSAPIEELSDEDLEQEMQRRRVRREAAERVAGAEQSGGSFEAEAWEEAERAVREGSGRFRTTSARRGPYRRAGSSPGAGGAGFRRPASPGGRDPKLAQLYAQLECPYGADINIVRKHYRAMMLKYHPDMHSGNAEKQRLATELSQRLTTAYNELRRQLSGS
jgi:DnaJ-domain-containing protein 1